MWAVEPVGPTLSPPQGGQEGPCLFQDAAVENSRVTNGYHLHPPRFLEQGQDSPQRLGPAAGRRALCRKDGVGGGGGSQSPQCCRDSQLPSSPSPQLWSDTFLLVFGDEPGSSSRNPLSTFSLRKKYTDLAPCGVPRVRVFMGRQERAQGSPPRPSTVHRGLPLLWPWSWASLRSAPGP